MSPSALFSLGPSRTDEWLLSLSFKSSMVSTPKEATLLCSAVSAGSHPCQKLLVTISSAKDMDNVLVFLCCPLTTVASLIDDVAGISMVVARDIYILNMHYSCWLYHLTKSSCRQKEYTHNAEQYCATQHTETHTRTFSAHKAEQDQKYSNSPGQHQLSA